MCFWFWQVLKKSSGALKLLGIGGIGNYGEVLAGKPSMSSMVFWKEWKVDLGELRRKLKASPFQLYMIFQIFTFIPPRLLIKISLMVLNPT